MYRLLQRRSVALPLLFCLVTGGFMLYRDADFYVWNDTPSLVYDARPELEMWSAVDQRKAASTAAWRNNPIGELTRRLQVFGTIGGSGYRPLDAVQSSLSISISGSGGPSVVQLLLGGVVYGALACCMFLLARRFTKYPATALLAVVLLFGAPPLVTPSWLVVASNQATVPLLISSALLLYWQIVESPRGRWLKLLALGVVLLIGPWFREFCGISCLLIGFLELRRALRPIPLGIDRRSTSPQPLSPGGRGPGEGARKDEVLLRSILMAMAGLFFLHAVFPTALIKWLFFPDLPLLSVTQMGSLGHASKFHGIHWEMAWMFLPLLPPLLVLLATCNGMRLAGRQVIAGLPRRWADWNKSIWQYLEYFACGVGPCVWLGIATLYFAKGSEDRLGYTLCLYVAAVGMQVDVFLVIWFLLSFVPLMRVVQETVHFLYVLVPTSIIMACMMESLWQWVASWPGRLRVARYALALALGVIVADQMLVIYGTRRVMQGQTAAIRAVAVELHERTARGSVVLNNVIHGVEIKWVAGDHYRNLWSMPGGVNRPECVVDEPYKFERLVAAESPRSRVYLLDCDFPRLPWKTADRHPFVHRCAVEKRSLGKLGVCSATYPFADPLRHFISPQNVPFLGPPDLVNDFYRGRALDGSWFRNEVYAEYHLYEVTGPRAMAKGNAERMR